MDMTAISWKKPEHVTRKKMKNTILTMCAKKLLVMRRLSLLGSQISDYLQYQPQNGRSLRGRLRLASLRLC
jgi:hypothetical protein